MIVMSITLAKSYYGTPGTNTTVCSIDSNMIKAVAHPRITRVTLYIYTPKIMKSTPIIYMAIV